MAETLYYLVIGVLLGLNAGVSPGPLFTLVISETIKHNLKEGIKIAMAPLFTDVPVLLLGLIIASRFSYFDSLLGGVSILGFIFLSYYAYKSITTKEIKIKPSKSNSGSLRKGIIMNFFNPHLYAYHLTISTPLIIKSLSSSILNPIVFIAGFLATLVGSKILLAVIASKSKRFLTGKFYIYAIRILGIILFVFALMILRNGLKLLKVI